MAKLYTIYRLSPGYDKDKGFSVVDAHDHMKEVATLIRYDKDGSITWECSNMVPGEATFTPEEFKKVWQPLAEVLVTTSATHASITLDK